MLAKINIREQLAGIDEYWSQKVIGNANGQLFKLAKGIGSTRWHQHDDQDELFIVYSGKLIIELREQTIALNPEEMIIVPRGVEHRPRAEPEAEFLIVGLAITSNAAGGKPDY